MNKTEDIYSELRYHVHKLLYGNSKRKRKKVPINKEEEIERLRIEAQKIEKLEKEKRAKEWTNIKDEIFSRYQIPIADDAKIIAKELFGELDTLSAFFITDERVVKQIYIEGGDKAVEEYAKNLIEHAFIGGPITATLLRRLKLLEDAKRDGKVIDTEIDIDGFPFNGKIEYALKDIELDGQIIPAGRKFSIRCEMTATLTEGFRTGPFVLYEDLFLSTKKDMEQITDEDIKENIEKKDDNVHLGERLGKKYQIEVCPHGTDKTLYCKHCQGDIIVSPSKKKVIGILLDISGSMHGRKLSAAKMAIKKILGRIPTNSNIYVVLIIFSTDLRIGNYEDIISYGTVYTQSIKNRAIKKIDEIIAEGSTPLYDTINYFLDGIWSIEGIENRIFFPYTYLIIVSDGDENQSELKNLIYEGKTGIEAFFAKLKAYRDAGLVTEIIPFAYGDGGQDIRLIRELKNISGKRLINEISPDNIIESLVGNVDSILYGSDNLKMMGVSINRKMKNYNKN